MAVLPVFHWIFISRTDSPRGLDAPDGEEEIAGMPETVTGTIGRPVPSCSSRASLRIFFLRFFTLSASALPGQREAAAILSAALTSAWITAPQAGHSKRLRTRVPVHPHLLHIFDVFPGPRTRNGIPGPLHVSLRAAGGGETRSSGTRIHTPVSCSCVTPHDG